jgi:hypothetical protein
MCTYSPNEAYPDRRRIFPPQFLSLKLRCRLHYALDIPLFTFDGKTQHIADNT